jgi:hypothetical protein
VALGPQERRRRRRQGCGFSSADGQLWPCCALLQAAALCSGHGGRRAGEGWARHGVPKACRRRRLSSAHLLAVHLQRAVGGRWPCCGRSPTAAVSDGKDCWAMSSAATAAALHVSTEELPSAAHAPLVQLLQWAASRGLRCPNLALDPRNARGFTAGADVPAGEPLLSLPQVKEAQQSRTLLAQANATTPLSHNTFADAASSRGRGSVRCGLRSSLHRSGARGIAASGPRDARFVPMVRLSRTQAPAYARDRVCTCLHGVAPHGSPHLWQLPSFRRFLSLEPLML